MANDLISHDYIMRPPYKLKKKQKTRFGSFWVGEHVETGESDARGISKPFPYLALSIFYLAVPKLYPILKWESSE